MIAESFLTGKIADADNPDLYQVIVHAGPEALTAAGPAADRGSGTAPVTGADPGTAADPGPAREPDVPAETRVSPPRPPGHPADPQRCHAEDGPAISVTTAQMIACTATLSWMLHDHDGTLLDVGRRRRRRPSAAQRRAARERDRCRCRFPGCESRRVDLHHIQYWINGGRTDLDNLISLCPYHHRLVHDRGYLITARPDGTFTFTSPAGVPLLASPDLPATSGTIAGCHDADITPETIMPAWYGERLDLDYAIYTCFANAEYQEKARQREREEAGRLPAPSPGCLTRRHPPGCLRVEAGHRGEPVLEGGVAELVYGAGLP